MRVDWVHPSWRDVVIESLAEDPGERRRFLRRTGVDGAAVALSSEGGSGGERVRPLLVEDADWDALGDGLHHLGPELDETEATRLLTVLADAGEGAELDALAALVLRRLGWSGRVVGVDALAAWLAVADRLDTHPELPAVAELWHSLEPTRVPRTPAEMERMADWLALAELLGEHDHRWLRELHFPAGYGRILADFAADDPPEEPPLERDLRIESLARLALMDERLAYRAITRSVALQGDDPWLPAEPAVAPPGFPIERVLRDLEGPRP